MSTLATVVRDPYIVVFDFDKTLARTDEPSPSGLTVAKAYEQALDTIFESSGLLAEIGGFDNQAPLELAQALLEKRPELVPRARKYLQVQRWPLHLIPEGKGASLARAGSVEFIAEIIVREKLALLLDACGTHPFGVWPRPVDGVLPFLARYVRPWGIISSGHDSFIEYCFELWGVAPPTVMVTDDDLRGRTLAPERKVKPSNFLMSLLLTRASQARVPYSTKPVLYVGDDLDKDGKLARNSSSWFAWYNPEGRSGELWDKAVEFRHFDELTAALAGQTAEV